MCCSQLPARYLVAFFNPSITTLKIERCTAPPHTIFRDRLYYKTITQIKIIEPLTFTVEYSEFLRNFDNISVLTLWGCGKLPFEFEIPAVGTLIIDEGVIKGELRKGVFEKVHFLEVGMRHDIPKEMSQTYNKIIGMGFEYDSIRQNSVASNVFVTFKNKNI